MAIVNRTQQSDLTLAGCSFTSELSRDALTITLCRASPGGYYAVTFADHQLKWTVSTHRLGVGSSQKLTFAGAETTCDQVV